jgi:phospholipase C
MRRGSALATSASLLLASASLSLATGRRAPPPKICNMRYHREFLRLLVTLFGILLSSCGGSGSSSGSAIPPPKPSPSAAPKIQHVVIIVQENRSFNDLFYGFPGARTATYGSDSKGRRIQLQPIGLETTWDLDHSSYSFFAACNGTGSFPGTDCRMNGFNKEYVGCNHGGYPPCPIKHPQYAYVPHEETKPYFDMA